MNISFLVTKDVFGGGGGIEKYTREVGCRLASRGHGIQVYSICGNEPGAANWEGITVRWVPRLGPYWAEKLAGSLQATALALSSSARPSVFHLHTPAAGAMAPLLRLRGAPCVLQLHGVEWKRSRWGTIAKATWQSLERIAFASANAITAVSKAQCEFYRDFYRADVAFIPTGTEVVDPIPPEHLAGLGIQPSKYFLTAVRLVREKGIHYLIPAFRKVGTDWKLVIAGADGGDGTYMSFLRQLAIGDERVQFLGHVQEPLLGELFSNAGAYVQASELEGMSLSILDAMSYGKCCIVSDIPENLDVLAESGLTFRSADIDDLARQMSLVVESDQVPGELGRAARERVKSKFSWDSVVERLEALYYEVIQGRAASDSSRSLAAGLARPRSNPNDVILVPRDKESTAHATSAGRIAIAGTNQATNRSTSTRNAASQETINHNGLGSESGCDSDRVT